MKKFIEWMNERFAPAMNKITGNPWVSSVQGSIMGVIPLILVGSLITMVSILNGFFPNMPDFSPISSFSFGLMSMFIAFLVPYNAMEKFKKNDRKIISGLTGIALFLMLLKPSFMDNGDIAISFERLGANGMFVSLFVGLVVAVSMYLFSKKSFFSASSSLPDFIIIWFDTIIPITLLLVIGWLFTFQIGLDLYAIIIKLFEPLSLLGQVFGDLFLVLLFALHCIHSESVLGRHIRFFSRSGLPGSKRMPII
ncbi:PTS transporter subunit EIIC [Sinanaerobacter chloroacetimidivorans]|uniref:PTS transporter subunit EIIC n=1 Tax=Sinanaerobacter chloroacetimidivorans TaxID=2818044 RepID=UPI001D04D02F|nr:PTS transporter subunit EIIC [Sinanaerobacter chloroacetimidivorans]